MFIKSRPNSQARRALAFFLLLTLTLLLVPSPHAALAIAESRSYRLGARPDQIETPTTSGGRWATSISEPCARMQACSMACANSRMFPGNE